LCGASTVNIDGVVRNHASIISVSSDNLTNTLIIRIRADHWEITLV